MSAGIDTTPESEFDFTLEEQWALHQAVLDHLEEALGEDTDFPRPAVELVLLEKIEAGEFAFTAFELDRLRARCDRHATREAAPDVDSEHARSVVEKIDRRCPSETPR